MDALLTRHAQGTLTEQQSHYFQAPRAKEELYDIHSDPHEMVNLANKPEYADVLSSMRKSLDHWLDTVGDRSIVSEEEMVRTMWPDRKQPITVAPAADIKTTANGKRLIKLSSDTRGASIGYRVLGQDQDSGWQLYTQPIVLDKGTTLETKAVRYGFEESAVTNLVVN